MPILDWLNKQSALQVSSKVPYRLLEPVAELAYGDEENENLLIQGDNLEALKALIPLYAGKVKCIYIDPPFNTKQAFEHYDDNVEHSTWLSLMYPRLELLSELLSDAGSIFIHIDDNELAYITAIMDEIYGRKNRINIISFKQGSATGHKAINPGMVTVTNFILVYAKNKNKWMPNKVFVERGRDDRYAQFIVNFDEEYCRWETAPLLKIFSDYKDIPKSKVKKVLGEAFEAQLNDFVITNCERVIRNARPDYKAVGEEVRKAIDESKNNPDLVHLLERKGHSNMYFKNGERWLFYKDKLKNVDGKFVAGEPLTNLWTDILSNNLHNEGSVSFPKSKKPEALVKRVFEIASDINDLVLDSFLGSGTTTAVAHKMNRRYIGIEMGEHAVTHCQPRLQKVVGGEDGGISKAVNWQGGGSFRFYRLGETVFDEEGYINLEISFSALASHIWYMETRSPLNELPDNPLLGVHESTAYYLLYNGILGDKRPQGGNVLTGPILNMLPEYDGPKVIYGETTRLGEARLKAEGIVFKQIPYDVRAR